jgi:transposase
MTKLVSMDLRERAMTRVAAGEGVRVVAMALSVAPWSVVKWSHRLRATGSAAPGGIGGHVPPEIVDDHKAWLIERVLQAFARACAGWSPSWRSAVCGWIIARCGNSRTCRV